EWRLGAVPRRRRARHRGVGRPHPAHRRGRRVGGWLCRPAPEHLLGRVGAARWPLSRSSAPVVPPGHRALRRGCGPRVRAGERTRRHPAGAAAPSVVSGPRGLRPALEPLFHARRGGLAAPRPPGLAGRAHPEAPRPLSLDVHCEEGISRRLARPRPGRALCRVCVSAHGQGVGGPARAPSSRGPVMDMANERERVLSGMRPTGKLHLGNYLGALANWVDLQAEYDCFYFVADWHVLTTDAADSGAAPGYTIDMIADWLGAGLDPERSTLFIQSLIPEHAELHLL